MVFSVRSPPSSCEEMMQEIAESSVESILTGMDTPEYQAFRTSPERVSSFTSVATPPTTSNVGYEFNTGKEWLSSPTVSYGGVSTSWGNSFCESSDASAHFRVGRQLSNSGYSSGGKSSEEENTHNSFGSPYECTNVNRSDSGFSTTTGGNSAIPMGITTVMLRNIPNKYTRAGLLGALVDKGFDPTIDCNNLYLPMDANSGCNLGYAFLNFTSHEKAVEFMHRFDGVRLPSAGSRKVCSVVWANKQGLFQHSNPPVVDEGEYSVAGGLKQQRPLMTLDAGIGAVDESILGVGGGLLPMISPSSHQTPSNLTHPDLTSMTPTCKIFVGGLASNTSENDLIDYFQKFGPIKEASIVSNRQTGHSRGFGFCEFFTPDSVDRVQLAQSRKPHSINCRVVSVRPYNFNQLLVGGNGQGSFDEDHLVSAGGELQHPQMRFTFFMGQGGIHPCQPQPIDSFSSY